MRRATQQLVVLGLALLVSTSVQAGIGDELNSSIKGLSDLQFTPLKGKVMQCFGINRTAGLAYAIYFMNGVEEGRSIFRLDKGPLDTKLMNKAAQTYGAWKHIRTEGKIKYFYCAERAIWSHYNSVNGYPTYFIYSEKIAQTLNGGQAQAPATFSPDRDL